MHSLSADRDIASDSHYAATAQRGPGHPALQGDARCDVAIVGGGLCGLSAATALADKGFSVRLLEAEQLGFGANGRNGGQAFHGLAEAQRVFSMSIEALDLIGARFDIDCDWRAGYLGVATSAGKARALRAGADPLARVYDYPMRQIESADLAQWIASWAWPGTV